MTVTLRPMTPEEFAAFEAHLWDDYLQTRVRNLGTSQEHEQAEVDQQRAQMLPHGQHTPSHVFWSAISADERIVGTLWVQFRDEQHEAFIYDIEVSASERGKGYGRQILDALEPIAKGRGMTQISLNVFGDNTVARRLYEHAGYQPAAILMKKPL